MFIHSFMCKQAAGTGTMMSKNVEACRGEIPYSEALRACAIAWIIQLPFRGPGRASIEGGWVFWVHIEAGLELI